MKLSKSLLSLTVLPLIACGQTTVNNNQPTKPTSSNSTVAQTVQNKAADDVIKNITDKLQQTYGQQKLKVQSVQSTPVAGLFEVVVSGNQVVYTDANADYMFVGDLIDVKNQKSLTEERSSELSKVDYANLPFNMAIKEVRGNGKLKVAVFSDPDCPFCKRLEGEFDKMTDITIYSFLMPISSLHPQANKKAIQIWCQKDRTAAWNNWMRKGEVPASVPECDNPVAQTTSLGEQLGFTGTPSIVFPNGKVQAGYAPKEQLQQAIENNQ